MPDIIDKIKEIYSRLRKYRDYLVEHTATAKLIGDLNELLNRYFFIIMFLFILFAIQNIFRLILSPTPDYDKIIGIGERGTLFLIAITGLVFTYASALGTSKNKDIINSGEYLLKSFLIFVIGMVFSIGLRKALINPSNAFNLPEPIFYSTIIIMFLLLIIALALIIVSGYFLVKGIIVLLKKLPRK